MSMFDLKGRRGIITGASSGLGLAMANVLAEAGATVYALSRTGGVKAGEAPTPANVIHRKIDVCDYKALEEMVKEDVYKRQFQQFVGGSE